MSLETAKKSRLSLMRKHNRTTITVFTMAAILITAGANAVTLISLQTSHEPVATTNFEMPAFSGRAMLETIDKACEVVGCNIDDLHPQILAYADTMDADQLEAGRWAQMRLIVQHLELIEGAPKDSVRAMAAHLELAAAARIARLYTARLYSLQ